MKNSVEINVTGTHCCPQNRDGDILSSSALWKVSEGHETEGRLEVMYYQGETKTSGGEAIMCITN